MNCTKNLPSSSVLPFREYVLRCHGYTPNLFNCLFTSLFYLHFLKKFQKNIFFPKIKFFFFQIKHKRSFWAKSPSLDGLFFSDYPRFKFFGEVSVKNVALTTKGLQERKTQLFNGTTVEK